MKAVAVEVAQYLDEHADERDAQGDRLVVRNGRAQARTVTCGAGTLEVRARRVNDERVADGERQWFIYRKFKDSFLVRSGPIGHGRPSAVR